MSHLANCSLHLSFVPEDQMAEVQISYCYSTYNSHSGHSIRSLERYLASLQANPPKAQEVDIQVCLTPSVSSGLPSDQINNQIYQSDQSIQIRYGILSDQSIQIQRSHDATGITPFFYLSL
ncbi:hypothetical protein HZ326_31072 [Fusarium oxysporum f. sp. albedinis]|nr:hypothetical protein HZ326_31072 [Fusarium oxysporum f. sp. albedinis]